MATEDDDIASISSRLTKGDIAPQKAVVDDSCSTLTGDTRESKARAYAAEETKKVTLQYVKQIDTIKEQNENKVAYLQAQLDVVLKKLQLSEEGKPKETQADEHCNSNVSHNNERNKTFQLNISDDEDLSEDDDELESGNAMSGLSDSSDDDQPIIVGVRNRRKKAADKESANPPGSPFCKKKDDKKSYEMSDKALRSPSLSKRTKTISVTPHENRYPQRTTPPPLASSKGMQL